MADLPTPLPPLSEKFDTVTDLAVKGVEYLPDPIVEQALGGSSFLGMELPKGIVAPLVGLGDQLGDAGRGIQQILTQTGVYNAIDEEAQDERERIIRALYEDPEWGTAALAGAVPGAILEPIGLLLPSMKAKKVWQAATAAAITTGLYGATLYTEPKESRKINAALGAASGGILGYWTHRFFRDTVGGEIDDRISELAGPKPHLKLGEEKVKGKPNYILKGSDYEISAPKTEPKKKKKKSKVEEETDNVRGLETRASIRGPGLAKQSAFKESVDSYLQPLYNNVKRMSAKVAAGLRRADYETHKMQKVYTDSIKPFKQMMDKLPVKVQEELHLQLMNDGLTPAFIARMEKLAGPQARQNLTNVQKVLNHILGEYKKVGYKIQKMDNYFPRAVRDLAGLSKNHQDIITKALRQVQKTGRKTKKTLDEKDIAKLEKDQMKAVERLLTFDPRFSNTTGSLQRRLKNEVGQEQIHYYHTPVDALYYYVQTAAEDLANRKFFSNLGYKTPKRGLDVTGADVLKSINTITDNLTEEGFDWVDKMKLADLLKSRFSSNVHATTKFVQNLKNLSYAGTLGNFWSAVTQFGDIIFAVHKYGIGATAQSILKAMLGRNVSNKERLGIDKAMQELNSERMLTASIADWAFKWGGFDAVDRFGKNVNINASIRYNKKLALKDPEKFRKKWEPHFGDDTESLLFEIKNLKLSKNEKMSDNAHLMLWNDLADTQPIGLSEMPQKYLEMPNGRVFYAYKTFTLKQMNYMRETLMRGEGNAVQRGANLAYFATLFVLANGSIDYFKDFMLGKRELSLQDNFLDNVAGLLGTNKYAVDKSNFGLGSLIMEGFKPVPVTQGAGVLDWASHSLMGEVDVDKAITKGIPVVGKAYKAAKAWEIK